MDLIVFYNIREYLFISVQIARHSLWDKSKQSRKTWRFL